METAEKRVLETYIHEATEVVHLTINGEIITSTLDHPFYVQDAGFVGAGDLYIGDKLLDAEGNTLVLENMKVVTLAEPVKVYNFKVEGFHTYHVGKCCVFVHNANCKLIDNGDGTYDAELAYKEEWTPEQRAQADSKCDALTKADTKKTKVERKTQPSVEFKKVWGNDSIPDGFDVDHIQDLQLNGVDDIIENGQLLDKSVNRSLGRQISYLIHDLDYGTMIRNFKMIG